jgi:hypothetical protein
VAGFVRPAAHQRFQFAGQGGNDGDAFHLKIRMANEE